ncbi:MAG: ISAs1 family transposase [Planctomycetaceae bacterium]
MTFPPRERRLAAAERQEASSLDKAHGRLERRTLSSTVALSGYLDWPKAAQVFKLVRERTIRGETSSETVYGVTSLGRGRADARRLLGLVRDHWRIENSVFYVRDMTLGEDHCRVRTGSAPFILATLRNAAIALLNLAGFDNKAAALRRHAAQPHEALALIKTKTEN